MFLCVYIAAFLLYSTYRKAIPTKSRSHDRVLIYISQESSDSSFCFFKIYFFIWVLSFGMLFGFFLFWKYFGLGLSCDWDECTTLSLRQTTIYLCSRMKIWLLSLVLIEWLNNNMELNKSFFSYDLFWFLLEESLIFVVFLIILNLLYLVTLSCRSMNIWKMWLMLATCWYAYI